MRVLVTGAAGFVGRHLVATLSARGHHVIASALRAAARPPDTSSTEWHDTDLRDADAVRSLVHETQPDAIAHLAAASSVRASWDQPEATLRVNVLAAMHLLRAAADLALTHARRPVLLVGSGDAYGAPGTVDAPLGESQPLRPVSPYGASKASQEMIGWSYAGEPGLRVVQARSFVHTGPGQRPPFVIADWALQLLQMEAGAPAVLRVGDTGVVRDITDVRDVASAYSLMLESADCEGVFNVCSGTGHTLRAVLDMLCAATGVYPDVEVDAGRLRRVDIPSLVGSPERLRRVTGWQPRIPLEDTLRDVVRDLRTTLA